MKKQTSIISVTAITVFYLMLLHTFCGREISPPMILILTLPLLLYSKKGVGHWYLLATGFFFWIGGVIIMPVGFMVPAVIKML